MLSGTIFPRGLAPLLMGLALCGPSAAQYERRPTDWEGNFGVTHITQWLQYANAFCGAQQGRVPNAAVTWTGRCRDGRLEGPGTLSVTYNGQDVTFTGAFAHGLADGPAQVEFEGDPIKTFTGTFHDNLPNGPGVLIETDGRRIAADYVYDAPAGHITIDYADGAHAEFTSGDDQWNVPFTLRFAGGTTMSVDAYTLVTLPGGAKVYAGGFTHVAYADGSRLTAGISRNFDGDAVYCGAHGVRYAGKMVWVRPDTSQPLTTYYPELSRRLNEQGVVEISLLVGRDGSKNAIALHRSSGFERLDAAALASLANWQYLPAAVDGHPIPLNLIVGVTFDLHPHYDGGDSPVTVLRPSPEVERWYQQQRRWMRKSCAALR